MQRCFFHRLQLCMCGNVTVSSHQLGAQITRAALLSDTPVSC